VYERPTHVIDLIHEVGMQVEGATVMMDAVDPRVMRLALAHPREDMQFMPLTLQRRRQFGDMHTHAAHTNRMQRFPGQHRDSHIFTIGANPGARNKAVFVAKRWYSVATIWGGGGVIDSPTMSVRILESKG